MVVAEPIPPIDDHFFMASAEHQGVTGCLTVVVRALRLGQAKFAEGGAISDVSSDATAFRLRSDYCLPIVAGGRAVCMVRSVSRQVVGRRP